MTSISLFLAKSVLSNVDEADVGLEVYRLKGEALSILAVLQGRGDGIVSGEG